MPTWKSVSLALELLKYGMSDDELTNSLRSLMELEPESQRKQPVERSPPESEVERPIMSKEREKRFYEHMVKVYKLFYDDEIAPKKAYNDFRSIFLENRINSLTGSSIGKIRPDNGAMFDFRELALPHDDYGVNRGKFFDLSKEEQTVLNLVGDPSALDDNAQLLKDIYERYKRQYNLYILITIERYIKQHTLEECIAMIDELYKSEWFGDGSASIFSARFTQSNGRWIRVPT